VELLIGDRHFRAYPKIPESWEFDGLEFEVQFSLSLGWHEIGSIDESAKEFSSI